MSKIVSLDLLQNKNEQVPLIFTIQRFETKKTLYALSEKAFNYFDTLSFLEADLAIQYWSMKTNAIFVDVGYNSTRIVGSSEGATTSLSKVDWNLQQLDENVK